VINTNLHPIYHRFEVIADYWLNLRFRPAVHLFNTFGKVFRIGTVRCNWPMSAHASQAFSTAHCTDSEDLPTFVRSESLNTGTRNLASINYKYGSVDS